MKVFNLTANPLAYRGVTLAPNGGSHEFRDMDFVPSRDMVLAQKRVIAFGQLPQWFKDEVAMRAFHARKAVEAALSVSVPPAPSLPTHEPKREADFAPEVFKKKK